ncbi:DUF2779 domain-containing protein [bacterium]|nr:DUF2779 domain-containing protein [bacterium]
MVDKLYSPKPTLYIVYNKSFESDRLKDIDFIIKDPQYHKKIESIRNHIFDLMNFFKNNIKKFPLKKNSEDKNGFNQSSPILSKKLRGYYTIKKVINELVPERILREVNCKRYNDPQLSQIHKGDVAKNATMLRYLSLFSNEVSMTNKD